MNRTRTGAGTIRRPLLATLAALALSPIACGSSGPGMGQVTGRVSHQGKPLPKGTITFIPTSPDGRNATGQIDAEGYYRLQTENPGDGALLGDYKVIVSARDDVILDYIPKTPVPVKFLAPARYEKPDTSNLTATVKSGSNPIDFKLLD